MRVIQTRVHGMLDYIIGIVLILAPWVFGFASGGAETWIPVLIGAGTIVYSMFTDYEMGVSPQISMNMHLTIDMVAGIFLAISPWLFGFAPLIWIPHLLVGLVIFASSLMTERVPTPEHRTRPA